jgi:hypothetical protein
MSLIVVGGVHKCRDHEQMVTEKIKIKYQSIKIKYVLP